MKTTPPKSTTGKAAQDREARLKAALKENLARRKAQARGKSVTKTDNDKTKTED